jgi:4'-phosphopantetheinyl transferase
MPLLDIRKEAHEVVLGIWHIEETVSDLASHLPAHEANTLIKSIAHPQKCIETLAGRVLVKHLVAQAGKEYIGLSKTSENAPFFPNLACHVSISHTAEYAVATLHPESVVGIDIEQARAQIARIAPRLMSEEELDFAGDDLQTLTLIWCAKETLYKIYRKKGLDFRYDMLVLPFERASEGTGIFQGCLFPNEPHPFVLNFYYGALANNHAYTWAIHPHIT